MKMRRFEMDTYAKILVAGRTSQVGAECWPLPRQQPDGQWVPGSWLEVEGPIELCRRGLHLVPGDPYASRWACWGMTAYAAEIGGELLVGRDKVVTNRARLLYPTRSPTWWKAGERFIADLAEMPWLRTS